MKKYIIIFLISTSLTSCGGAKNDSLTSGVSVSTSALSCSVNQVPDIPANCIAQATAYTNQQNTILSQKVAQDSLAGLDTSYAIAQKATISAAAALIENTCFQNAGSPTKKIETCSTGSSHMQKIKDGVACLTGHRLIKDTTFFITSNTTLSTIGGNFQAGILPGDNSELHVGVSAFRDLIFVTKVTNGTQVLGYNITLSLCEMANSNPNFPMLISNDRQLTDFKASNGILLDMGTYCGYGVVDAAIDTWMTSQPSPSNQMSAPFTFPISFTKPFCNSQF